MKNKKLIIFLSLMLFSYSCAGAGDALKGKKRSENSDEFLVEKKNPLTVPPDMNELPVPLDEEESNLEADDENLDDIKKVLDISENNVSTSETNDGSEKSLEESILEKINN